MRIKDFMKRAVVAMLTAAMMVTPIEQNNRIEIKMDHINNNINYVA